MFVITGAWVQAAIWAGVSLAQHTAVDLHLEKLGAQGWEGFWTDNEFARLTPH